MSKLSNLIGKAQSFKIGDIELELKPLKFENMDLLAQLDDEEKRIEAMQKIISITLKEAVPDATDDEINQMGITHIMGLSEAIAKVNGLKQDGQPKQD